MSAKATEDKVVPRATACTVQSAAPVPSVSSGAPSAGAEAKLSVSFMEWQSILSGCSLQYCMSFLHCGNLQRLSGSQKTQKNNNKITPTKTPKNQTKNNYKNKNTQTKKKISSQAQTEWSVTFLREEARLIVLWCPVLLLP